MLVIGSVSMAGMGGLLWAVTGGNKRVAEQLLETSKAQLIHKYITKIDKNNETYTLFTNDKKNATYDYVVFAAPLAENLNTLINFPDNSRNQIGKYHKTVTTMVIGEIKKTRFPPLSEDSLPFLVISNNEQEFFNSISNVESVNDTANLNVWKVFSQNPLSRSEIDQLFESTSDVKVVEWLAYPHYKVPTYSQSFHIAERFYHINAIEWIASAMEMSCIGARNVALLIKKHFYGQEQSGTIQQSHTEL